MTRKFREIAFTPDVLDAQQAAYGRAHAVASAEPDPLTSAEREFIARRDSFYLATVNRDGWPYIQHRGGAPGFLRVLDDHTLAFADLAGNRQLVSTGNLAGNDRVALFLMDYPGRRRLKILGRAEVRSPDQETLGRLYDGGEAPAAAERVIVIDVVAWDWNCPQHITPRFATGER